MEQKELVPIPRQFVLKRMSDEYVMQTFFENDIEEVLEVWHVKRLIESHFSDRARPILEYLWGYHEVLIDLDEKKAAVVRSPDSAEGILQHLREEIYTLRYLTEGEVRYNHAFNAYVVDKNLGGKVHGRIES